MSHPPPEPAATPSEAPGKRILPWLGLLAILAVFWWWAHDFMLPGFTGIFNDDGTYFTSARALAQGKGYVLSWAHPPVPADRFPIGYPAWLALFWTFPMALLETRVRIAQEANVILAAGFVFLSFAYLHWKLRLPLWAVLAGVALAGLSPFSVSYASTLMSDLPAGLCLVGALWLATRFIEKPAPARLVLAGVMAAVAMLVRYQTLVLPVVAVAYLAWQRRFKDAASYGGLTLALLVPWVWWVQSHHAFGYAGQIAHQTFGTWAMRGLSLAFSALYMFGQALPSFLWSRQFLPDFPFRSMVPLAEVPFLLLGLSISAAILTGLALAWRRAELRLPVALVAGTLALIVVWQTGFLNLGELLTVRLALGVAPLLLTFSLVGWADALRDAKRSLRIAAVAALVLVLAVEGGSLWTLRQRMVSQSVPRMLNDQLHLTALVTEFARQVPEDALAGSNFEPRFHLITGRPCTGAANSAKILAAQILSQPKLQFLVLTPTVVGTTDITLEAIKGVNRRFPGLIYTIEGPDGRPTGVFRLDRTAIERAPVLKD